MSSNAALAIRLATEADAPAIWEILRGEIEVMRLAGRDQWQRGYPNPETIAADIAKRQGWVLLREGAVVGYCALITTGDAQYDHIWNGAWLTRSTSRDCRYAVVHRIGVDASLTGQGLATAFLRLLLGEAKRMGCESMRIDTNHDNAQMLHILPKIGFTRCGMVMVKDGERHAFEMLL
ncbi:MAG: GNAT family N-acetyltransferase [Bacteroidales bacterium]|nr:GNAT family N-acetyltransferase [Bacteroidales bacterium]